MTWILLLTACREKVDLGPGTSRDTEAPATGTGGTTDTPVDTDTYWTPGVVTDTTVKPASCESWCTCLVTTCDFPQITDVKVCVTRCEVENITQEELDCWDLYCDYAATLAPEARLHYCEHAAGLHGLEECP